MILSKLNWAKDAKSEMQLRDLANILRNDYDEKYVETWRQKLGVTDLLNEALGYVDTREFQKKQPKLPSLEERA